MPTADHLRWMQLVCLHQGLCAAQVVCCTDGSNTRDYLRAGSSVGVLYHTAAIVSGPAAVGLLTHELLNGLVRPAPNIKLLESILVVHRAVAADHHQSRWND